MGNLRHSRATFCSCLMLLLAATVGLSQQSSPGLTPVEINPTNWYWGPANTWSWRNTRRLFPSARVGRGKGPVAVFQPQIQEFSQDANHDLGKISFGDPVSKQPMTVDAMLDATYTDGFIVLHHGRILSEMYRNGLTVDEPHLLMSVSKSIMGTLAGILVTRGQLDTGKLVTDYVPELKGTLYDGATVRNLLDMSVDDPQARAAASSTVGTVNEYQAIDEAGGWLPQTATSAPGFRAYLAGLRRAHGEDGKQFQYLDQSAILIGWVMERATGQELPKLLGDEIWSKLGAEQDAYILLDHQQQSYSSAGFNATLRDLARFGQMMAQGGRFNGQQIVPVAWVKDIRSNGAVNGAGVGLAAPAPWPGHGGGTYRDFWWVTEPACGRFTGVGLGGQLLVVDPVADMVVVKLTSTPKPELDDSVFETEYKGIDAIIQNVSGHGCS